MDKNSGMIFALNCLMELLVNEDTSWDKSGMTDGMSLDEVKESVRESMNVLQAEIKE